jgi:hypothetical protein
VEDGSITTLRKIEFSSPPRVCLSPDGKYIAYNQRSQGDDVFLLPAAGGTGVPLVSGPYEDRLLAWTPDGRHILFSSNRSGTFDAELLRVENGKAAGAPELLKQDFGMVQPIGFAPDGKFYFGRDVAIHDIVAGDLDPQTGKLVSTPQKATEHFAGSTWMPASAADGKKFAYVVHRSALYYPADNQVRIGTSPPAGAHPAEGRRDGAQPLVVARRRLPADVRQAGSKPERVPDRGCGKRQQLARGRRPPRRRKPQQRRLGSGRERRLLRDLGDEPGTRPHHQARPPDGKEKVLSLDRFHNPMYPGVSPDGRQIAVMLAALMEESKPPGPAHHAHPGIRRRGTRAVADPARGAHDRLVARQPVSLYYWRASRVFELWWLTRTKFAQNLHRIRVEAAHEPFRLRPQRDYPCRHDGRLSGTGWLAEHRQYFSGA